MMEPDCESDCAKYEMATHSVPPGYASLTSFVLRRVGEVEKTNKSTTFPIASRQEPTHVETRPEMNDIAAYKTVLMHRPWIISDQSYHKPEESHTVHLPMDVDVPLTASRPKGTIRGCPNCSNCLKVTARWHPEDARREVMEEAPIFYPTEEEFQDTFKYIESIRSRAEPYGICRIVPPPCWKPPCNFLDKRSIWENSEFVAQIQRIDGHQVRHAQEKMASSHENTKTNKRRDITVPLDSQHGNRNTCTMNDQNVEDCDSETVPRFSLKSFKKYADEFKIQYFNYKDKNKIAGLDGNLSISQQLWEPSVENIEGEYGRIVQNPTEEIEVLSGNIEEDGVFSSGFSKASDSLETYAYPEYIKSGWNLNTIPSLSGSLLSFESSEASCNFSPRVHVGMCFSPLNWKVEEHHLYTLSYMHLGEPKVWYSVPGSFFVNFETIWKKYLPDLCAGQPDDMHDKMVMQLSCSILKAEGIPVYRCVQYPREYVLVFPGVYHSGFDCGFNCSEAVSFAPLDWLLHGQNVVELYCEQRRKTLISYDKLLLGAAREAVKAQWETMISKFVDTSSKGAYQINGILTKALNFRIRSECLKRKFICNSLTSRRLDEDFDATCKRECCICLRDLYLSAVSCSCSDDKFACLDHAKQLCSCAWSNRSLLHRYEISDLNTLCQALDGKLSAVYRWAKKDLGLSLNSVAAKGSKQGSNCSSVDLMMKESISQGTVDARIRHKLEEILNSSEKKQNEALKKKQNESVSQIIGTSGGPHSSTSNLSKRKQNEVVSQVIETYNSTGSKMKTTTFLQSTISNDMKGINFVGNETDTKEKGHEMENEENDKPNPGCVHILVHFVPKGETKQPLNIDPNWYSYVAFVDDIHKLATASGCLDGGSPLSLSFCHPNSQSKNSINSDSDVVDMFKLNINCIYIHVYVGSENYEDNGIGAGNCELGEIAVSNSNNEWSMSDESQQVGEETNLDCSYIDDEGRQNDNSNGVLGDYEVNHDLVALDNSDEDKVPTYFDKGMKGKLIDRELDGKVKFEAGLLFADVTAFRAALRYFVVQEGFEIKKIRNEKTRVTAICAVDGCCWRIHASPTLDGQTYKIKTYNPVHSCIRTSKNSNVTFTSVPKK